MEAFKLLSNEEKIRAAKRIYTKYFLNSSKYELNLPAHAKKGLEDGIKNPSSSTFDAAQEVIWNLMVADSVPHFFQSNLFHMYQGKNLQNRSKKVEIDFSFLFLKKRSSL